MKRYRLALGLDLGSTAVRIAHVAEERQRFELLDLIRFVPTSDRPERLGLEIATALAAARIRERKCIAVLHEPEASLRLLTLPIMPPAERLRAGKLEARRIWGDSGYALQFHPHGREQHRFVLGAAQDRAIRRLQQVTRVAGLRLRAIDHAAYALGRVFCEYDALLDIGLRYTRFVALGGAVPFSSKLEIGGDAFTNALAKAFRIDVASAERRKHDFGFDAGCEHEMKTLIDGVGRALRAARAAGCPEIERIGMIGNGGRAVQLRSALQRDTGCLVELAVGLPLNGSRYAPDVLRAAAPDWALAIAAATWESAERLAA